jgi:hypothetical protein
VIPAPPGCDQRYLSELLIEPNLVLSLPPNPFTAAMIASAMPAAINPYSIAVAPDWSVTKALNNLFIAKTLRLSFQ